MTLRALKKTVDDVQQQVGDLKQQVGDLKQRLTYYVDDEDNEISISLSNAMLEKRKGSVKSQDSGRSSSFRKAF